jgi:putative redox protein
MKMKIDISRKQGLHFVARNESGNVVEIDGSEEKQAMRPMELLLTALGSCSAFDAVGILEKQRQTINGFSVEVTGDRPDEGYPKPYESIHLRFTIEGKVERAKAERALALAVKKYCSVSATFRAETAVTHELNLVETTEGEEV